MVFCIYIAVKSKNFPIYNWETMILYVKNERLLQLHFFILL